MSSEMLTIRISSEQKAKLESLANQQGCSVSDVIRGWVNKDDISIEVPQEVADIVAECAEVQNQSIAEFVREYATEYLRDSIREHSGVVLTKRIKQLLKEKGPLTEEGLLTELPERVRNMNMDDFMRSWLYHAVQKTDDGKYELKKEQL